MDMQQIDPGRTPQTAMRDVMTVIGPDGDEYHRDHVHLDLQPRGAGGQTTFCQ